jgi:hypothetical protein
MKIFKKPIHFVKYLLVKINIMFQKFILTKPQNNIQKLIKTSKIIHFNKIQFVVNILILIFSLLGSFQMKAQSTANCYGPYSAIPESVWGIAQKFESSPLIWGGDRKSVV